MNIVDIREAVERRLTRMSALADTISRIISIYSIPVAQADSIIFHTNSDKTLAAISFPNAPGEITVPIKDAYDFEEFNEDDFFNEGSIKEIIMKVLDDLNINDFFRKNVELVLANVNIETHLRITGIAEFLESILVVDKIPSMTPSEIVETGRPFDLNGMDLADIISSDKPFKTLEEKGEEDLLIQRESFKNGIVSANQRFRQEIDTKLNLDRMFSFNTGIDALGYGASSLYKNVLNRVSLIDAVKQLVTCLPIERVGGQIPLPRILTFEFLAKIPTVDLMAGIDVSLQGIIDSILASVLSYLTTLSSTVCSLAKNIGAMSIRDLLDSDLPGSDVLRAFEEQGFIEFSEPDEDADFGLRVHQPNDQTALVEDVGGLLDEISSLVTPFEAAKLLRGVPTQRTLELIQVLGTKNKTTFSKAFTDFGKIQTLFNTIGKSASAQKLDQFLATCNSPAMEVIGERLVCKDLEEAQESIISDDALTPADIKKILDSARQTRDRKIKDFNDFLDKVNNGVPPITFPCSDSEDNLPTEQLPGSFNKQLDSVLNTVFDGVYSAFDREAGSWNDAVVVQSQEPLSIEDDEIQLALNVINPEEGHALHFRKNGESFSKKQREINEEVKKLQGQSTFGIKEFVDFYKDKEERRASLKKGILKTTKELVPSLKKSLNAFGDADSGIYRVSNSAHILTLDTRDALTSALSNSNSNIPGLGTAFFPIFKVKYLPRGLENNSDSVSEKYSFSYRAINNENMKSFSSDSSFLLEPDVSSLAKSYTPPGAAHAPSEVFGRYMESEMIEFLVDDALHRDTFRSFMKKSVFEGVSRELLARFSSILSNSSLFDKIAGAPRMSGLQFNLKIPVCGDQEPGLLNLSEAKKQAKRDFNKHFCANAGPGETNESARQAKRPSAVEKSILSAIIKTTVRAYAIDYYLRGILVFEQFSLADGVDKTLLAFLAEEMAQELLLFGKTYRERFLESVSELYSQENGESSIETSLKFFLERELISVSEDISKKVLFRRAPQRTPMEKFLFDMVPLVEVTPLRGGHSPLAPGKFYLEKYYRSKTRAGKELNPMSMPPTDKVLQVSAFENEPPVQERKGNVKQGLRLIYVVPQSTASEELFLDPETGESTDTSAMVLDAETGQQIREDDFNSFFKRLNRDAKAEKLFKVRDEGGKYQRVIQLASVEMDTTGSTWEEKKESLYEKLLDSPKFKLLFTHLFPLQRFVSMVTIYNLIFMRYVNTGSVLRAFSTTKERLRMVFQAALSGGDYSGNTSEDPYLRSIGGQKGLESLMRTPPEKLSAKELQSLLDSPGFNYWQIIKFVLEAPVQIFRGVVESMDPNIFIASKLALFSRILGGVDVPVAAFSIALQPMTMYPSSWYGPPLTPLGMIYLSLGLGFSTGEEQLNSESTSAGADPASNSARNGNREIFSKKPGDCEDS